jgi:hypothetical protein
MLKPVFGFDLTDKKSIHPSKINVNSTPTEKTVGMKQDRG